LTLWPLEIQAVRLSGMPLPAPPDPAAARRCLPAHQFALRQSAMTFTQLGLDQLRFLPRNKALLLELLSPIPFPSPCRRPYIR
jgi:type VI secretion system protein ImpG